MAIKEEVYFDGGPHKGDLILGIILAFTVICIPITVGAIVRALWLRYRITDRRLSITGGWLGRTQADAIYTEIDKVIAIPRGFGGWGDIGISLLDGSTLEMRAVPNFREVAAYIEERMETKQKEKEKASKK
ncbi:PH domain-containing protein [filamentous cyanobacterium LEGE 11480]|uniref:PH domain-containing protein n=1 Tax=Romeriopsis navalis LEGE 11480 TaxID=2777977 RepID=A0A928Z352_9CYAN|nr:PH domain-containing protein [Romeriopsis navalis]MBE9028985.1 PH domain-containing protein [Romeriopsis navalis LEGE 11480]